MIKNFILAVSVLASTYSMGVSNNNNQFNKPLLIGGSSSVSHLLELVKPGYQKKTNTPMQIRSMGSEKGIRAIAESFIDLGSSSRYLTNEEQEKYPHITQIIIAQDALVFFTNIENKIDNISVEELRNVYSGKYENWQQINPDYLPKRTSDKKVLLFSKATNHGTFDILLEFLDLNYMQIPNSNTIKLKKSGNRGLFSKQDVQLYDEFNQALGIVQRMPNAIAYESYGAISQLLGSKQINKVNILGIDGVKVNHENIQNGNYTFVRPLILLVNSQSERSVAQAKLVLDILKTKKVKTALLDHHYSMAEF
ncbi:substrate-binding domain-containing protein [Pseudoalteromonas sp. SWXJZ94C]|uniref:PstS family phosphate ABC transporter substrate-binding protein n=1 Tax=unclassified Pseudoalteromonas TaxID=194690 RepID=UPI0014096B6E|nr:MULTISPECIES: substrate-binding domain-containing protein [unclassified Pseudoalteromonas]MBH0056123.1 substrate-binding domain-containing protein [Pseudoalteromonas sp. SWXJZ94C]